MFLNYLINNGFRYDQNPFYTLANTAKWIRWTYDFQCLMNYFETTNSKDSIKSASLFKPYSLYRKLTKYNLVGKFNRR